MEILWIPILFLLISINLSKAEEEERPNIWRILADLRESKDANSVSSDYIIKTNKNARKIIEFFNNKNIIKYFVPKKKTKKENIDRVNRAGRLGSPCFREEDCDPGTGHVCSNGSCQCHPRFVHYNATHCLPGVLLGFSCLSHHQCRVRVPMSSCIQGFCRCGEGSVPYRRANCLPASTLGQSCRSDVQCSIGIKGSYCKWIVKRVLGKCRCKHGMPRMGNKCGSPGFALGAPCGKSYDCSQHVPGAICVSLDEAVERGFKTSLNLSTSPSSSRALVLNKVVEFPPGENDRGSFGGICKCPEGYLPIKNGTKCVPLKKDLGVLPVSLGKPCYYNDQCKASDPFSFCNNGFCDCLKSSECSAQNTGCHKDTFQCFSDGRCVSPDFVCDGKHDCRDASDESVCSPQRCSPLAFTCDDGTCISRAQICDGRYDCPDKSDEKRCSHREGGCPSRTFRCKDGNCLPAYEFCNALPSCKDKSDEDIKACVGGMLRVPHCPFRCNNGRCRSLSVVCSGSDGCGDNSDEENCSICNCPRPT